MEAVCEDNPAALRPELVAVEVQKIGAQDRKADKVDGWGTPWDVLTSRFSLFQIVFNMIASAGFPTLCFWLLFGVASEGPYDWYGLQLTGVAAGSMFCSPNLIMAIAPAGMPEAVDKGWFFKVRVDTAEARRYIKWLPFLGPHRAWRTGFKRHLMLGLILFPIYIPITLLLARFAVGPTLDTWTQIWFNVIFEVLLAPPVTAFGLLGFAMEPNYERVERTLSRDPSPLKRLVHRVGQSLKMLC